MTELRNPAIPYGPAVDDRGTEWENTSLADFLEAMDAFMTDTGWTEPDRQESLVWTVVSIPKGDYVGDSDDLRRYLTAIREWASDPSLPDVQHWSPRRWPYRRDAPTSSCSSPDSARRDDEIVLGNAPTRLPVPD